MSQHEPLRADQNWRDRAGDAWVRQQERVDAQLAPLGRAVMQKLGLKSGDRVLDVGCGTGQTVLELSELVGDGGHVLGVDISETMLARARERVETAGRRNVELVLADAQQHRIPPHSFDALFSRFGVMFFQDSLAAFRNLHDALKPSGKLGFVCWQALEENDWAHVPLAAVRSALPDQPLPELFRPGAPGPFYFADTARVRSTLVSAGFERVAIDDLRMPLHFGAARTLDEAADYAMQIGPAARMIAESDPAVRPELERRLRAALEPFVTERERGVWFEAAAFIVTARAAARR